MYVCMYVYLSRREDEGGGLVPRRGLLEARHALLAVGGRPGRRRVEGEGGVGMR